MDPHLIHHREIRRFVGFLCSFLALSGLPYALPHEVVDLRPWIPGESIPVVHLFGGDKPSVQETSLGQVVAASPVDEAPAPEPEQTPLSHRPPAVATPLEVPEGGLDAWFQALSEVEAEIPGRIARALHWGDSTIAGDGITATVRARLQERFGDGGPGFLAVQVDPRWALRPGVARWPKGDWDTLTITFGGAESRRYGLAGTVSTAPGAARTTLGGLEIDGERQLLHRFEVFYQRQPDGGSFKFGAKGAGRTVRTASERVSDAFLALETPEGAPYTWIITNEDGPVTLYGVALETQGPGVTWETLGVAGSSIGSLQRQGRRHLEQQVAQRNPDLVVYMTGGNEVGYPSLEKGAGEEYAESYKIALSRIRRGAPEASCLILSPLDQATRKRGQVTTKDNVDKMVKVQRQIALEEGCAFWDAWQAMGGDGAFGRWLNHDPPYAWTDLMHLTTEGQALLGDSLADALLQAYDDWSGVGVEIGVEGAP